MLTSLVSTLNPEDPFDASMREALGRQLDPFGRLLATGFDSRGVEGPSAAVHEDNGIERGESGFV